MEIIGGIFKYVSGDCEELKLLEKAIADFPGVLTLTSDKPDDIAAMVMRDSVGGVIVRPYRCSMDYSPKDILNILSPNLSEARFGEIEYFFSDIPLNVVGPDK
jgi:hypothetical protein